MPLRSEIPADAAPVPAPPLEPLDRLTVRKIPAFIGFIRANLVFWAEGMETSGTRWIPIR
jgi:hypothetical protein